MAKRSPLPVDKVVGENIRVLRLAKGMSQGALGVTCGITFQQIQKYEKGANRCGASRMNQIANALGVPVAALFDGIGKGGKIDPARAGSSMLADAVGTAINAMWSRLTPQDRIALRDLAQHLAAR